MFSYALIRLDPTLRYAAFSCEGSQHILFRRIGAMYLALALIFFLGRAAAPSDMRSAVCLVMGGAITLLSGLGLFEFLARRVSAGVFRAVVGEAVLAAGFVWLWWVGR